MHIYLQNTVAESGQLIPFVYGLGGITLAKMHEFDPRDASEGGY